MSRYEETLKALNMLKDEMNRLRRVEQEYIRLKREYEALLKQVKTEHEGVTVKPEEGFFFCTDDGVFTEYSALNLEEFREGVKRAPSRAIEFHMERGDFEKWLTFIGMQDLVKEFENIRTSKVSGENLRKKLLEAMDNIINL